MWNFKIVTIEELIKMLNNYSFKQLHIHHTYKPDHSNFNGNNHIELQEAMYRYHTETKKWSDIAQHVTLAPDGKLITGRDFNVSPASIAGWNKGAFAVEMIGNFDVGKEKLEGEQKKSILMLSKYFADRFGYDCIKFHREGPFVTKTCPGNSIDKKLFLEEVKNMGKIFVDVDEKKWSAPYIQKAYELEIMKGYEDGTFKPSNPLTREEAAVLIVKLYEKLKN
ncbi:S-layer homology domain-containing protein [Inediibacterium massiliense]|uniref:S-layer homology domain-containing protein n=1 Tax=Inediibacterium massiliense TaxID=1658111 RepID=UPI0006B4F9B2|nr:S-layer homology domain-containing protein [Inediibacterium massiliense]